MSFRTHKRHGLPVVRISGIEYVLDMRQRHLTCVDNPNEVIDLEGEGCIEVDGEE